MCVGKAGVGGMGAMDGKWPTLFAALAAAWLVLGAVYQQFLLAVVALAGFAVWNCIMWVFFTGGIWNMVEALEASWMPRMPWPPPRAEERLKGRTVLVTGASRGLGRGVARYAHGFGADVVLADVLDCASVAGELELARKGSASALSLNLCKPSSIVQFAEALGAKGAKVELLVLNAGIADKDPVPGPEGSSVRRMFWVNYLGNVILVDELRKHGVLAQGARVLVVCSGSYEYGDKKSFAWSDWNPLQSSQAYAQSKFLVTIWANWLSGQLRPRGIEVVSMCPGPMNSGLGCEHVPLPLWPSFMLMRELIYKPPEEAARTLINFLTRRDDFPAATYLCCRVVKKLLPVVEDADSHAWLLKHTKEAFAEVKYAWDPEQ